MSDRTLVIVLIAGAAFWYMMHATQQASQVASQIGGGRSLTSTQTPTGGSQQQAGQDLFNNVLGLINNVVSTVNNYAQTQPERNG